MTRHVTRRTMLKGDGCLRRFPDHFLPAPEPRRPPRRTIHETTVISSRAGQVSRLGNDREAVKRTVACQLFRGARGTRLPLRTSRVDHVGRRPARPGANLGC